jgi:Trp operon repressor
MFNSDNPASWAVMALLRCGWTQRKIAAAAGTTAATVCRTVNEVHRPRRRLSERLQSLAAEVQNV